MLLCSVPLDLANPAAEYFGPRVPFAQNHVTRLCPVLRPKPSCARAEIRSSRLCPSLLQKRVERKRNQYCFLKNSFLKAAQATGARRQELAVSINGQNLLCATQSGKEAQLRAFLPRIFLSIKFGQKKPGSLFVERQREHTRIQKQSSRIISILNKACG